MRVTVNIVMQPHIEAIVRLVNFNLVSSVFANYVRFSMNRLLLSVNRFCSQLCTTLILSRAEAMINRTMNIVILSITRIIRRIIEVQHLRYN